LATQTSETAGELSANSEQLREMVTVFTNAIQRLARQEAAGENQEMEIEPDPSGF
jgi:hypothetical protein